MSIIKLLRRFNYWKDIWSIIYLSIDQWSTAQRMIRNLQCLRVHCTYKELGFFSFLNSIISPNCTYQTTFYYAFEVIWVIFDVLQWRYNSVSDWNADEERPIDHTFIYEYSPTQNAVRSQ